LIQPLRQFGGAMTVSLAALVLATTAMTAQQPVREGFWGSVGAGYGTADIACGNCGDIPRESSFSGFFVMGLTLNPSLLVGLEVDGWVKSINGDPLRLGGLNGTVQWYPSRGMGLFIKGGIGMAYARGDLRFPTSVFLDDAGLGYLVGVGYDVPISGGLSITPLASFYGGNIGDVQNAQGVNFNVLQFLVALTLH
jgi:hypothetical protein